jgi:hypothetical protein
MISCVVGQQSDDGSLAGRSLRVETPADARTILANADSTLEGELKRQLLVAKLNGQRGLGLHEDLRGGLVYGTTVSVRTTLRRADAAVSGVDLTFEQNEIARLVDRLSSINLGQITYQQPGVPFPANPMADDDADGIMNLKDNCPSLPNPLQEDRDDDRVGDACRVQPRAECVLQRSENRFEAFFSYDNPLSFRSIPAGARNTLVKGEAGADPVALDGAQPTEFLGGSVSAAFRVPLSVSESARWTVEGYTAVADGTTAHCSGRELTQVPFAAQVALFASESVELGDYTSVTAPTGSASIVSGGDVTLGAHAAAGHVISTGRTRVGRLAAIFGSAVTGGALEQETGALVTDARVDGIARAHSLDWVVSFGTGTKTHVTTSWGQVVELPPGEYGSVVVNAGAQVVLQSGSYRFDSLHVDRQATLSLGSGEIVVHVASSLVHGGATTSGDTSLVLGYLGSETAWIEASLAATVVAPRAELVMGSAPNSIYRGAFFARRIVVGPGTTVEFAER